MKLQENQEISEKLLNELISTQLTPKLDIDEAQDFSGSPSATGNKTVTERYLECSQKSMMGILCKIVDSFYLLTIFATRFCSYIGESRYTEQGVCCDTIQHTE